jgi:mannitol 2-dehydrogenase
MSCDNLPGNGDVTRAAVTGLARLSDPALADWIAANVAFPNGMVDRITPATGPRERALAATFGLGQDPVPVTCEPFRQWVVEDAFPQGRPALEKVGVTFTPHVHAFEKMKIRILNGGHATIAYPGGLMGIEFVHQAMAHPLILGFLTKVETEEIIPYVPPPPGTDLAAYFRQIVDRFSNPEVADTERRLCLDGSNRQPKFIVPSIRDALAAGGPVDGLALVSALWCRYCYAEAEDGTAIAPNDPDWDALVARSRAARTRPGAWLDMTAVYGDLGRDARFAGAFARQLARLWAVGTARTLAEYLGAARPPGSAPGP